MDDTQLKQHINLSKWILAIVIGVTVGAYVLRFHASLWASGPDAWGQFGDYLGGVMNPLIAFGAFYWLVTSVALQKTELSETRKALSDSQQAQQQQADTALLAAKIQTINIRLSSVANKLAHARSIKKDYLGYIHDFAQSRLPAISSTGENYAELLNIANGAIQALEDESDALIKEVERLADAAFNQPC